MGQAVSLQDMDPFSGTICHTCNCTVKFFLPIYTFRHHHVLAPFPKSNHPMRSVYWRSSRSHKPRAPAGPPPSPSACEPTTLSSPGHLCAPGQLLQPTLKALEVLAQFTLLLALAPHFRCLQCVISGQGLKKGPKSQPEMSPIH